MPNAIWNFGWHAQEKEKLSRRVAALEEKQQRTQVYVLDIVRAPPLRTAEFQILYFFVDHLWTIDEAIQDTYTKSDSRGKLVCKMQRVFHPQADSTTRRQTGSRYHQWMMKASTVKKIEFTVLTSDWICLTVIFWFDNKYFCTSWWIWDSAVHDSPAVWMWRCF